MFIIFWKRKTNKAGNKFDFVQLAKQGNKGSDNLYKYLDTIYK